MPWDPAVLDAPVDAGRVARLLDRIGSARDEVLRSSFCASFRPILRAVLDESGPMRELVCYGLGSVDDGSRASRYQLALAQVIAEDAGAIESLYFDPAFNAHDRAAIESVSGATVMRDNEQCARRVRKPTLFYMPHCHTNLYAAVLEANSDQLAQIIILGNSFAAYDLRTSGLDRAASTESAASLDAMARAIGRGREIAVPDCKFPEVSAFNNLSFHAFFSTPE